MKKAISAIAALLCISFAVSAKIELPSFISSHMVLQQNASAAIWGKATPGAKVSVKASWTDKAVTTTADRLSGKWLLRIDTPAAGGPFEIKISDGQSVSLSNILVGEVWFCSGQSNMEMPVKGFPGQPVEGSLDHIISANPSLPIRICNIKRKAAYSPVAETEGSWVEHTPDAVAETSAAAYFFAEQLQKSLGVPVGIITSYWGGSKIEAWIDRETLEKEFAGEISMKHMTEKNIELDRVGRHYGSLLYNGQVDALIPFTFKGMLWYQGESNLNSPDLYIRLQAAYVKMMRRKFENPDAPFYFVQLAPYAYKDANSTSLSLFREAQEKSLDIIPNSGMASTLDLGEMNTIHPRKKIQVGHRLAALALEKTYGYKAIESSAPKVKSIDFKGGEAIIRFDSARGINPIAKEVGGFELAGPDHVFHPATAINKQKDPRNTFHVSSKEVPDPIAVRYAFHNGSEATIFSSFGIPIGPFRSDNW